MNNLPLNVPLHHRPARPLIRKWSDYNQIKLTHHFPPSDHEKGTGSSSDRILDIKKSNLIWILTRLVSRLKIIIRLPVFVTFELNASATLRQAQYVLRHFEYTFQRHKSFQGSDLISMNRIFTESRTVRNDSNPNPDSERSISDPLHPSSKTWTYADVFSKRPLNYNTNITWPLGVCNTG